MADSSSKPPSPSSEMSRERLAVGLDIADRYRIQEVIGEGGMGTVYAAEHLALHKKVAIKVLHLDLLRVPNIVARFEREARATARIDHPNVTNALDFGRLPNGALYLVLEFVDGRRLREQIAQGPFVLARALSIARQIASVLATAQTLGIVHRDLKPENVILVQRDDDPDFVKVLDFGIARMASPEDDSGSLPPLTKLGAVFGTPEYMAPEQALGQRVDTRADLYSLGVILFEMITGVRPYVQVGQAGILSQQITSPRPTFAERAPGIQVPPEVEQLVYRLLAKGAQERYQRATDVVTGLEGLLSGAEVKRVLSSIPPAKCSEQLPSFELTTQLPKQQPESTKLAESIKLAPKFIESLNVQLRAGAERTSRWCRSVGGTFVKLSDQVIDSGLQRLPEKPKQRITEVPRGVWRGLVGVGAVLLILLPFFIVGALVRVTAHRDDVSAAPTVALSASAIAVETVAPTASVVSPSLDENSKDPEILLTLALSSLQADNETDALSFVVRALSRQPERRNDERVATVLYRTTNSVQKEIADKSLALLQGMMAARGAEIQYQLWIDRSIRDTVRKRIDNWLRSEAFERTASGAIHVAVKLRLTESCEKKLALLPMAGKIGGMAALRYLEELQITKGCGFDGESDCYPCLRRDHRLRETVTQIQSRLNAK